MVNEASILIGILVAIVIVAHGAVMQFARDKGAHLEKLEKKMKDLGSHDPGEKCLVFTDCDTWHRRLLLGARRKVLLGYPESLAMHTMNASLGILVSLGYVLSPRMMAAALTEYVLVIPAICVAFGFADLAIAGHQYRKMLTFLGK